MGGICGKNNESEENESYMRSNTQQIHLQNKKEFLEQYKSGKLDDSQRGLKMDSWGDSTSSYEDIRKVYFFDKKELGHGHFGSVRRAKLIIDPKKMYAVKTINKEKLTDDLYLLKRELEILRNCDHPNIAKFYESYQDNQFFHFVLEYCSGGDICDVLKKNSLPEQQVRKLMFQILSAVNHLHEKQICHRDIKPENFQFVSKENQYHIKLIDFGLSKNFTEAKKLKTVVGTPYYVAPDVFKGSYDERCDYWSCGAMMFVMLAGAVPFSGKNNKIIFNKINKCKYSFSQPIWNSISDGAKSLITRFQVVDPDKRLTCRDALQDKYFQEIDIEYTNLGKSYINEQIVDRLRYFRTTSRFQKEVIKIMVNLNDHLPEIQHLRHVFFYLDYLNNGVITQQELNSFFKESCKEENISDHELAEIVESLHLRQKGVISYTEFIAATIERKFFFEDNNLQIAFKRFDVDDTGFITTRNIKECFARFGYQISNDDIKGIIGDFDIKHDGKISLEEFVMMMKSEGTDKRIRNVDNQLSGNFSPMCESQHNIQKQSSNFGNGNDQFMDNDQPYDPMNPEEIEKEFAKRKHLAEINKEDAIRMDSDDKAFQNVD